MAGDKIVCGLGKLFGALVVGLISLFIYKEYRKMNKRIFVSFAIEDKIYRDMLYGQAKNSDSPFNFVDMSAKEAWDEKWGN